MYLLALHELKEATAEDIARKAGLPDTTAEFDLNRLCIKKFLIRRMESDQIIYLLHDRVKAKLNNGDDIYQI
jgi:hypothetical protein